MGEPNEPTTKVLSEAQLRAQAKRQEKLARRKVYGDLLVQGTNDSSIVSKRSVERLYGSVIAAANGKKAPEYFKPFVRKPQRRSPVINRGYWIRVQAISRILDEIASKSADGTIIINLGCGYDPLPFERIDNAENVFCIDVDYPELIKNKTHMITSSPEILEIIGPKVSPKHPAIGIQTERYAAVGCDLRDLKLFKEVLSSLGVYESNTTSIFVAEVSLAYMLPEFADPVIAETSAVAKSHFVLLEQIMPAGKDHPFARTMLKHFNKIGTPLGCVSKYHNTELQEQRFRDLGFLFVKSTDLWTSWKETDAKTKHLIETIEGFDEWEEFLLFCQHYVVLHASVSEITEETIPKVFKNENSLQIGALQDDQHVLKKFLAGAAIDENSGDFVLVGGTDTQRTNNANLLTLDKDSDLNIISHKLPARMCHSCVNVGDGEMLLLGGRTAPHKLMSDSWRLKSSKNKIYKWIKDTDMPFPRSRMAVSKVGKDEVLVFGGLEENSSQSAFMVYNIELHEWTPLTCDKKIISREGAAMCLNGNTGIVIGGMVDGAICPTAFSFKYSKNDRKIEVIDHVENVAFARYGSKAIYLADDQTLVIGGVSNDHVLGQTDTVISVSFDLAKTTNRPIPDSFYKECPMLVGNEIFERDNVVYSIGGGAVCFSFGSVWNGLSKFSLKISKSFNWELKSENVFEEKKEQKTHYSERSETSIETVSSITVSSWKNIQRNNIPVLIKTVNLGSCISKWKNPAYLKSKVGQQNVVVHESSDHQLNFQKKNFNYATVPFGDFVDNVFGKSDKKYYLRALNNQEPKEKAAKFVEDFPMLADDFQLPDCFEDVISNQHSSPLRIASPGTSIWLHYDVTANILCQIVGTKKIRLFAPSSVDQLAFPAGASSSTINNIFTEPSNETAYTCTMEPGDILFIPRLWLHATNPEKPSISLNFFWKDLENALYAAGKDVYGNRDIAAYENGRHAVQRVKSLFDNVPEDVREFYLKRLAEEMLK